MLDKFLVIIIAFILLVLIASFILMFISSSKLKNGIAPKLKNKNFTYVIIDSSSDSKITITLYKDKLEFN